MRRNTATPDTTPCANGVLQHFIRLPRRAVKLPFWQRQTTFYYLSLVKNLGKIEHCILPMSVKVVWLTYHILCFKQKSDTKYCIFVLTTTPRLIYNIEASSWRRAICFRAHLRTREYVHWQVAPPLATNRLLLPSSCRRNRACDIFLSACRVCIVYLRQTDVTNYFYGKCALED